MSKLLGNMLSKSTDLIKTSHCACTRNCIRSKGMPILKPSSRNKSHARFTPLETRYSRTNPYDAASRPASYYHLSKPFLPSSYPSHRYYSREVSTDKGSIQRDETLTPEEAQVLEELEREQASLLRKTRKIYSLQVDLEDTLKRYSDEDPDPKANTNSARKNLKESISVGYIPFENEQRIIQDVNEEIWNPVSEQVGLEYVVPQEFLQRGITGVFDLSELVDLLRDEKAVEIVVISIPHEIDYAEYMIIVTATSPRHLMALATYVRKRYKMKQLKKSDVIPKIISQDSQQGWIALDMGNIILHLFLQEQRDFYDLELLWTVGPLFDDLCNAKDPEIIQLLNSIK